MTDDIRPEGQTGDESQVAVENPDEVKKKLTQQVELKEIGPCRKHIRVSIDRKDVEERMGEHFSKLVQESVVTGFRPGKAPRKLIEKRFQKEVHDRVKGELLLASLEQLGEENDVAPLAPPEIDPDKIEIPAEGPLVYEFEVEVRPQFDLPAYKGLKLRRPIKTFTDEDIAENRRRALRPDSQIIPKEGKPVELGDIVVADITVRDGERVVGEMKEATIDVERQLAFKDGLIRKFGDQIVGANIGDTRLLDVELSSGAAGGMGGKLVQATFEIKDLKTRRLPELTPEYLAQFGLATPEQLDESIRAMLERNLEHQQRRSARLQILQQINESSTWELPQDLLRRQARRALNRRIMEMRSDGMSEEQITREVRLMEQDILQTTALTLKEHFVLQKIAEVEKIEVDQDDINDEIERLAEQYDESPRRIRARLEKEDAMESLMAEMVERRALDLILDSAEYQEVPIDAEETSGAAEMATVEAQAVPGEMQNLTETPAEAASPEKSQEGK